MARFFHTRIVGKAIAKNMMIEWVGPRCSRRLGINRSMSAIIEATNNRGMLTLTFRSLDVAFPLIYPKARWPTANVCFPSLIVCVSGYLSAIKLSVLLSLA